MYSTSWRTFHLLRADEIIIMLDQQNEICIFIIIGNRLSNMWSIWCNLEASSIFFLSQFIQMYPLV